MRFISTILLSLAASVLATPAPDMSLFERGTTSFTIICGRGATSDAQCLESFSKGFNGVPDTVSASVSDGLTDW
jgi:hypothetical protein